MELLRFLAGFVVLAAPGVALAVVFRFGHSRLQQFAHGSCFGLSLAIYLSTLLSYRDLRWFYPAWAALAILTLAVIPIFYRLRQLRPTQPWRTDGWVLAVLLLVAVTRLAAALPHRLPEGLDPRIFMVQARKIQLAQHAVYNWQPFDDASITYPPGAHTLVVIWSALSGLPIETISKDLIAWLGVLSTVQVWLFTRKILNDPAAALFAAMAYGLWAGVGSVDFMTWGGLPNELAMVLFMTLMSIWFEEGLAIARSGAIAIVLAALVLSHHHTQMAAAAVLTTAGIWAIWRRQWRGHALILFYAGIMALAMDLFFLAAYLPAARTISQTHALVSEWPITFSLYIPWIGLAFLLTAGAGIYFCMTGQVRPPGVLAAACSSLTAAFIVCEFVVPPFVSPPGPRHATALNPSHFVNDLVYFLSCYAGIAIALVQRRLNLKTSAVLIGMTLVALSQFQVQYMAFVYSDPSEDDLLACQWIQTHTPPDAVLIHCDGWNNYFAWRRGAGFILPDSERRNGGSSVLQRLSAVMADEAPPDSPDLIVLQIEPLSDAANHPILWRSPGGLAVVQLWPQ